jgi:hypothetical protein
VYILGILIVMAIGAGIGAWLGARHTPRPIDPPWDIPRVSQTFTTIVGTLAGFSIASSIFLANLTFARDSPAFGSLIGIFLIAFLIFVATAQEFGTTPNIATDDAAHLAAMRYGYLVAMMGYFVALALSWNALRLLLLAIDLTDIADVFRWILLFIVVTGAARLSVQHVGLLTTVARSSTLIVPVVGFAIAAIYRFVLVPALPALSPPANEPFAVAVVCFGVAAVGFVLQSGLIASRTSPRMSAAVLRLGEPAIVALLMAVTIVVTMLWAAVAVA